MPRTRRNDMTEQHKPKRGRPSEALPKLNTTPETLAKELLTQRPLRDVEREQKAARG